MGYCRPVDVLTSFQTATCGGLASSTTRYAIRQALDQEYQKSVAGQRVVMASGVGSNLPSKKASVSSNDVPNGIFGKGCGRINGPKRDFFGRVVNDNEHGLDKANGRRHSTESNDRGPGEKEGGQIFVSFHEGYSNAVRKPITLDDLMRGL